MDRFELYHEALSRLETLAPGAKVTNVWAGHPSLRHGYLMGVKAKQAWGPRGLGGVRVMHTHRRAHVRGLDGKVRNFGPEGIVPGWLTDAEASAEVARIHPVLYGAK